MGYLIKPQGYPLILALSRTGSSGITCVSNSLTEGTGLGHIDDELSLW